MKYVYGRNLSNADKGTCLTGEPQGGNPPEKANPLLLVSDSCGQLVAWQIVGRLSLFHERCNYFQLGPPGEHI